MAKRSPYKRKPRKKGTITPQVRKGMEQVENLMLQGWGLAASCRHLKIPISRVYGWRKRHQEFDATIRQILATPRHRERISEAVNPHNAESLEQKKTKFLARYAQSRDRNEALNMSGLDALEVQHFLDEGHEDYDAQFAKDMAEQEARILWMIEDDTIKKGLDRDGPTQRFVLAARMKEIYGQKAQTPGNKTLAFYFTADKDAEARAFIRSVFETGAPDGDEPPGLLGAAKPDGGNGRAGSSPRH